MKLQRFKDEHAKILVSVSQLRELIKGGIPNNAAAIAQALVGMSSTIKLHLSAEDQVMYPAFAKSPSPEVAEMGRRFQNEMGGIAEVYGSFSRKWLTGERIAQNPEAFRAEANAVFQALNERIKRENNELYPTAEGLVEAAI